MAQRAGWEARIKIGPNAGAMSYFAVKRWSIEPSCPLLNADNTEGKPGNSAAANARGFASRVKNIRSARIMLEQATFDDTDDPFAAPYNLAEGVFVRLELYPAGAGVVHTIDSMCISKMTVAGEVGQLQPVTIEAESDGNYDFN
jgi:hypothetical protein